jgi:regulator of sigma E protease
MIGINIIAVVILLGILIFVHELGHFLAAKYAGVGVLKFSLGFGPRLFGKKRGETEYLISAVPLGGYVKLLGESEGENIAPEDEKRSFLKQPVIKRIGIVAAGPFFNFLFAVLAFALIYMIGVPALTTDIGGIQKDSMADKAGLREKDRIIAIDGKKVDTWGDISEIVTKSEGKELTLLISRGNDTREIRLTPQLTKSKNIFGEEADAYKIGVLSSQNTVTRRLNPVMALWEGAQQTWVMTELTFLSVVKLIEGVISPSTLGGPILIAQMAGAQVKKGILPFIFFMAILSVNLGVLNLLPVPVLDGGHLFFYLIELVTRREINIKWREWAQQIGFVLLILLMLFVFYNDIMRIFSD